MTAEDTTTDTTAADDVATTDTPDAATVTVKVAADTTAARADIAHIAGLDPYLRLEILKLATQINTQPNGVVQSDDHVVATGRKLHAFITDEPAS